MRSTPLLQRHAHNPILTATDWHEPVNAVFNAGASRVEGETVLLCRVEDRRGISHLWVARSEDGLSNWRIDRQPLLSPRPHVVEEQWGFEDPRVVHVPELDCWVITCTSYGPSGPAVFLATTDFSSVERRGLIMPPEDKNAAILPRRIHGDWLLLHRPTTTQNGPKADIWLSRSQDLHAWRTPERVMQSREGPWWDSVRLGIGPPPIETEHGWFMVYHGVKMTVAGATYRAGMAMLDLHEPTKVIHRAPEWILAPTEPYERVGDVGNVVFPCGAVHDTETDQLHVYYGAADTVMAVASAPLTELVEFLRTCPPD
jgi:predicted GH43/DUF377 family glycosyl hydrolase